jgi:tetratricopeptide (TPR) repeat protein
LVDTRWSRLSFYEAHRLMELTFVRDHQGEKAYVLDGPEGTLWLNGLSNSIHDANEAESLALTQATVDEATVIDYLKFFCLFVTGDEGSFIVVESDDQFVVGKDDTDPDGDTPWITVEVASSKARQPQMCGVDTEGRWLADATIFYDGVLYGASFAVPPNGEVEMIDDDPIGFLRGLTVATPLLQWDALATADPEELSRWVAAADDLANADPDNPEHQRELSISLDWLADARLERGETDGALSAYTRSLAIAERLAKAHPGNRQYSHDLAVTLNLIGDVHNARGEEAAAVESFSRAVDFFQRMADDDHDDLDAQLELADSLSELGDAMLYGDGPDAADSADSTDGVRGAVGALRAFTQSLDVTQRLVDARPESVEFQRKVAARWFRVGSANLVLEDAQGALQARIRSLEVIERMANDHPDDLRCQRSLAICAWGVASIYEELGDAAAADFWRRAHEVLGAMDAAGRMVDEDRTFLDELTQKVDPA